MEFRFAKISDAAELLAIYRPYVEETAITFEYDVPTETEFARRIKQISEIFPYLVALENGKIVGYAYASRYRERKAYDWVVELSIYLAQEERQKGLGTVLYQKLLTALSKLNYQRAYACVTYPNPASIAFHKKLGFHWIGVFEKSGYKFEQWYGIAWLDLPLQKTENVKPIRLLTELSKQEMLEILA